MLSQVVAPLVLEIALNSHRGKEMRIFVIGLAFVASMVGFIRSDDLSVGSVLLFLCLGTGVYLLAWLSGWVD